MNKNKKTLHKVTANVLGLTLASVMAVGAVAEAPAAVYAAGSAQTKTVQSAKKVYLNGAASTKGDGTSKDKAVNSLDKALELAGSGGVITVCGAVSISGEKTISVPEGTSFERAPGFTGAMIKLTGKGKLTVKGGNLQAADVDTSGAELGSKAFVQNAEKEEEEKEPDKAKEEGKTEGEKPETPEKEEPETPEKEEPAPAQPQEQEEPQETKPAKEAGTVAMQPVVVKNIEEWKHFDFSKAGFTGNGVFSWASEEAPKEAVSQVLVKFLPSDAEEKDYSQVPGWNAQEGAVYQSVQVTVEALKETAETPAGETPDQSKEDEEQTGKEDKEQEEQDKTDQGQKEDKTPGQGEEEDSQEDQDKTGENGGKPSGEGEAGKENEPQADPDPEKNDPSLSKPDQETSDSQKAEEEEPEKEENESSPSEEEQDKPPVIITKVEEGEENKEEQEETKKETEFAAQEGKKAPQATELPEAVQVGSLIDEETGIRVSGDFLPYYADLRVEVNYDASQLPDPGIGDILSAYEIELWDLKEDEKYQLPAGEKVTVMIPLPENAGEFSGLSIAHYLGNNQYEYFSYKEDGTGTMRKEELDGEIYLVFETASFSPFNIGGHQLVGPGSSSSKDKTGTGGSQASSGASSQKNSVGASSGGQSALPSAQTLGQNGNSQQGKNGKAASDNTKVIRTVKTGDESPILLYVLAGGAALVLAALAFFLGKRKK